MKRSYIKGIIAGISISMLLVWSITEENYAKNVSNIPLSELYTDNTDADIRPEEYVYFKYPYYASILEGYSAGGYVPAQGDDIEIDIYDAVLSDGKDIKDKIKENIEGTDTSFLWDKTITWARWEFDILDEGLYEIEIQYYLFPEGGNPARRTLLINGSMPFLEANNIVFPRMWNDVEGTYINSNGDEARPKQAEVSGWRKTVLCDGAGMYPAPFRFYFEKGRNSISLEFVDQEMAISKIVIRPAKMIPGYEEVRGSYEKSGYIEAVAETIKFQAEDAVIYKSAPTIRKESDADPMTEPVSYLNRRLNVIGGWGWREGNQSVTWKFTVPEDGLYKIGMRVGQWWNDGLPSFRKIEIDGSVPFKELEQYSFSFARGWQQEILSDPLGEPYLFYLTKGEHTITMSNNMGELTAVILSLNDDLILLSNVIYDITKITGGEPDPNYRYNLMEVIPDLRDRMEMIIESMQNKYDLMKQMTDKVPGMANNFLTIKSQVSGMLKNPDSIPRRLKDLSNAQITLGSWYRSLQNQPLLLDYFLIGPPNEVWVERKSNIFQKLRFTIGNFIASFKKDYDSVGSILQDEVEVKEVLQVWVARGIEWAEVIKGMADTEFTPGTGISIAMNVLPPSQLQAGGINALMLSIVSGKAPDVALGVDNPATPVEFAIRDAVYDLSMFDDFDEVSDRFLPSILIPYRYRDGVFALPETMNFNVLFYRKDIISELGIMIPDTREDLYNFTLPALYQNNMQFGYPAEFTQFIFQHGAKFYTEDSMRSALDTPEAYRAFRELTEIYTNYGIPIVSNLFNRMRTGEMPMGIGNYYTYMLLSVAAPELINRWGIAPLPGIETTDGIVDRSWGGLAAESAVIMNQTEKPKEAWEFLKWWTSEEVQLKFARQIEAIIGAEARWNTANVEAFNLLRWKQEDLDVIRGQWEWAKETPVVLGGYFTGRHLVNAWNRVIINGQNIRDALEEAVFDINRELRMKQEEYGIFEQ